MKEDLQDLTQEHKQLGMTPKKKVEVKQEIPKPDREVVLENRKTRKSSRKKERRLARERAHNLRAARAADKKGKHQ